MSQRPSQMDESLEPIEEADTELHQVNINLKAIENVMIAENRRRVESN